jgi:general secretion pathway protein A
LNLQTLLRSPELRQLDQRVSIRHELRPLDEEAVAGYVAHRLTIAGGSAAVAFTAKALRQVHRHSGGIPRLVNLICDRALLAGFSHKVSRITPDLVNQAAKSLELAPPTPLNWVRRRASLFTAAAVVLLAAALVVGAGTILSAHLLP